MADYPTTGDTNNTPVNDSPQIEHKRLILSGIIMALWIAFGILGVIFKVHFYDLSVYFLSLTGFVGAYMISETKRPSVTTSVFKKGRSSKREITVYVVTALWLALGVLCIALTLDLLEAAAYFSALTPYISTYLIGSAYKPDLPKSAREQMYNNSAYGGYGGYGYGGYGGYGYGGYDVPNTVSGFSGHPDQGIAPIVNIPSKPQNGIDP